MLRSASYLDKNYLFKLKETPESADNVFTVIVGKNGTGKSRLMKAVTEDLMALERFGGPRTIESKIRLIRHSSNFVHIDYEPEKIITASTSPFDKFPLLDKRHLMRHHETNRYAYLGIRDLSGPDFGLAYVSKIISSLIEAAVFDLGQMREVNNALNFLGYRDRIRITIEQRLPGGTLNEIHDAQNVLQVYEILKRHTLRPFTTFTKSNSRLFEINNEAPDYDKIEELRLATRDMAYFPRKREFDIDISSQGFDLQGYAKTFNKGRGKNALSFLLDSGIYRVKQVSLEPINGGRLYSISDASSGEQSAILSILGIASHIKDRSLICIDEPEICLHPEWQEKYMKLLIDTFANYKGCHFLIATHSPQIVSSLNEGNCFILFMESGEVVSAKGFAQKSSDFQLANVFNHPGFKNEYLSRIALSIFTKVSARKKFDSEDIENYEVIKSQVPFMKESDPVFSLFQSLRQLYQIYA